MNVEKLGKACLPLVILLAGAMGCANVPSIKEIRPNHGAVGTVVEIAGSNFGDAVGDGKVTFGEIEVPSGEIVSWSASAVRLRVPTGLEPGPVEVTLQNDLGFESSSKTFTVEPSAPPSGRIVVVSNAHQPGIQAFRIVANAAGFSEPVTIFEFSLRQSGFETTIRGLAAAPQKGKLYATVERRALGGGEDESRLVVFSGNFGEAATAPTLVDVGVQPTGMALSPDGSRLYVASTASGMLTVVDTETDTVLGDITAPMPIGFEPLNVVVVPSPAVAFGAHLVAVIGNNWADPKGQVLTFAPDATDATQKVVADLSIVDTYLNGALAVSGETSKAWLLGERGGAASIAFADLAQGHVVDQLDFAPGQIEHSGFSAGATRATDVFAANGQLRLYVALPEAGVAVLGMPTDGLTAVQPGSVELLGIPSPLHLSSLPDASGNTEGVLVTRPGVGNVSRIDSANQVLPDYLFTHPRPMLIESYATEATTTGH